MNKFFKCLIITTFALFALTTTVFGASVSIDVDSSNNAKITIKGITEPIYSIQLDLTDSNSKNTYTFKGSKNHFYQNILTNTSNNKNNITLLIDEVDKYLTEKGDLLVGVLTSTGKPNFGETANFTIVNSSLSSTKTQIKVSATYKSKNDTSSGGNSSGNGGNSSNSGSTSSGGGNSGSSGGSSGGSGGSSGSNNSSSNGSTSSGTGGSSNSQNSTSGSSSSSKDNTNNKSNNDTKSDKTIKSSILPTTLTANTSKNEATSISIDNITLPKNSSKIPVFNDIYNFKWAEDGIIKLARLGVIKGDGQGGFNPSGKSKRADVVIMLINLLGLENSSYNDNFSDVDSSKYYAKYVAIAKKFSIVSGTNGKFYPEDNISRQDTMVMVANILKQLGVSTNKSTNSIQTFSDFNQISDYAKESVSILVNLGIISGNDGKINPKKQVTRVEMSVIISKLYDLLEKEITS